MLKHALLLQPRRQFRNQCCNKRIFFNISDNFGKLVLNMRIFFKICDNFGKYLKTHASFQHLRQLKEKRWNMRILSIICENYGNILKYAHILQQRLTICEKVEDIKHITGAFRHLLKFWKLCRNTHFFFNISDNFRNNVVTGASSSKSAKIFRNLLKHTHLLQHLR